MRKVIDRDLICAAVLFFIGGVALTQMGTDMRNWLFPQVLTYLILLIGAILTVRFVFAAITNGALETMRGSAGGGHVFIDIVVFCAIVLVYIMLVNGLGFWLDSFLMLSVASVYLTPNRTRRNMVLAVVVPLVACVLAYVVFLHVFYVPVPVATWWPGFG